MGACMGCILTSLLRRHRYARGKHKIGCCYLSLVNLPPEMRNRLEYTIIVTLVLDPVVKRYGAELIFGGARKIGHEMHPVAGHEHSLGAVMRALNDGVKLAVPDPTSPLGGYIKLTHFGWMLLFCADFPAAGKFLNTSESTAALEPCRGCNWQRKDKHAKSPSSFIQKVKGVAKKRWELRTTSGVRKSIRKSIRRSHTPSALTKALRSSGSLYSTTYCLQSQLFPYFDAFAATPQDVMHAEFSSGTANTEAAVMLYNFISVEKWFTVDDLNQAIDEYDWEPGQKPPPIYASVAVGKKGRQAA